LKGIYITFVFMWLLDFTQSSSGNYLSLLFKT
jgi:hypothetical protein